MFPSRGKLRKSHNADCITSVGHTTLIYTMTFCVYCILWGLEVPLNLFLLRTDEKSISDSQV